MTRSLLLTGALALSLGACAHHRHHDHDHGHHHGEAGAHLHEGERYLADEFDTVTDVQIIDGRPTKPGSHQMLREAITAAQAQGLEVIISDVIIPPNGSVPLHRHPGEEFLYVIEGSALHRQEGIEDMTLSAGQAFVITPGAAHSPVGGPGGARAIVFRVHVEGQPERILIDPETGEELAD